jgi:hypothetical protein
MRKALPIVLCSAFLLLLTAPIYAQRDRFAYAITDLTKEGAAWNALRKLDLRTGQYSAVLLNGSDAHNVAFDAGSRQKITSKSEDQNSALLQSPFGTGVAAAAYDRRHNRLYFTPMYIDQLRYLDLKTMKLYYVADQPFTSFGNLQSDAGKIVSRMVINPDGVGYAITNDGNTFIRFTTDKKPVIEQLGPLVDDPANKSVSIHNSCTSYGGDMIADDQGNLYIISGRNYVFTVNTETKVATLVASIKNLPGTFTVNGAVVNDEGNLLVSSAVDSNAYYVVNPNTWEASKFATAKGIYRSSDLANSNYLGSLKRVPVRPEFKDVALIKTNVEDKFGRQISIYPNPVTENYVTVQFNKVPNGEYVIELTDVLGRTVIQKKVSVTSEDQTHSLQIKNTATRGTYLVKVFDRDAQSVFTKKVLVQ